MDFSFDPISALAALLVPLQIIAINLTLSGDNALVIALATKGLPPDEARITIILGTMGAIVIRIAMGVAAVTLMQIPFLKMAAALLLLLIAVRLTLETDDGEETDGGVPGTAAMTVSLGVIGTVIVADVAMSLDNVVAVASVANGSVAYLVFGLALSIPFLVWGSLFIKGFLDENRFLILAGGIYLGWLAGSIFVSDPAVSPWIASQATALTVTVPLACAIFVLWQNRILRARKAA